VNDSAWDRPASASPRPARQEPVIAEATLEALLSGAEPQEDPAPEARHAADAIAALRQPPPPMNWPAKPPRSPSTATGPRRLMTSSEHRLPVVTAGIRASGSNPRLSRPGGPRCHGPARHARTAPASSAPAWPTATGPASTRRDTGHRHIAGQQARIGRDTQTGTRPARDHAPQPAPRTSARRSSASTRRASPPPRRPNPAVTPTSLRRPARTASAAPSTAIVADRELTLGTGENFRGGMGYPPSLA
jgi:hypothetical protein